MTEKFCSTSRLPVIRPEHVRDFIRHVSSALEEGPDDRSLCRRVWSILCYLSSALYCSSSFGLSLWMGPSSDRSSGTHDGV
eukprot:8827964-Pyramimonas_sp.AAC.1